MRIYSWYSRRVTSGRETNFFAKSLVRLEKKIRNKMFPLLFVAYVVAVKVFKKTTPNGEFSFYSTVKSLF